MNETLWITQAEAAVRLGLSIRRVLEYCTAGKIRTSRPNGPKGARVLLKFDVEQMAADRTAKTDQARAKAIARVDFKPAAGVALRTKKGYRIPLPVDNVIYGGTKSGKTEDMLLPLLCQWVTLEEASQLIGLPRRLLRARILAGKLAALRVAEIREKNEKAQPGDCWRVKLSDLAGMEGEFHRPSAECSAAVGM